MYDSWNCYTGVAKPYPMKNCKVRTYVKDQTTYLRMGKEGESVKFVLIGYKPAKGHPEYNSIVYWEMKYLDAKHRLNEIPAEAIKRIVAYSIESDGLDNPQERLAKCIVEMDGHCFVKEKSWSCSKWEASMSKLGRVVDRLGVACAILAKKPDTVPDMETAKKIRDALNEIGDCSWCIDTNQHQNQKDSLMKTVESLKTKLEDIEKEFTEVCDKSADALNLLSEKYGISLDL